MHNTDDCKNKLLISKEREIFKNIYNERLDKIEELTKKIDYRLFWSKKSYCLS